MMGRGSVGELHLNSRVQHIGSHPHSPGRCGRRSFIFTPLCTSLMSMLGRPFRASATHWYTYFRRASHLTFLPLASALHATIACLTAIF